MKYEAAGRGVSAAWPQKKPEENGDNENK